MVSIDGHGSPMVAALVLEERKRGYQERRRGLKLQVGRVGLFVNDIGLLVGAGLGGGTTLVPRDPMA
jgi:hypothetical protein